MWPQWLTTPKKSRSTPNSPRNFSCSSFKDIHNILREDSLSRSTNSNSHGQPKKPTVFHRVQMLSSGGWSSKIRRAVSLSQSFISPPDDHRHQRITIYFTSLHVVRKTHEDCKTAISLLRGFHVPIDERDLSMDDMYIDELQRILGSQAVKLPSVFIGGRYVGGAEEIKELHETGELKRMIWELPLVDPSVCNVCGGLTFVLCDHCNGSHKIYYEDVCGFLPCTACNHNGLIRCPSCYSILLSRSSSIK
ncbi:uncharacterized protein At5g39865-like [Tripterygium wilfordii]|uniref:uncharacterized protein At5g39865-like n=1 Tax=Tripterygium wilfordii TaxID=458696 RepID=UPI0018F84D55|nr:uncharacterized protein At5g39865-like [Tripterygium wilfordii]